MKNDKWIIIPSAEGRLGRRSRPLLLVAILLSLLISGCISTQITKEQIQQDPYAWVVEFTTPSNPAVLEAMQGLTNNDGTITLEEIKELQKWTSQNIRYSTEDVTYPAETLANSRGSCWSSSSLMYSFILAEDSDADSYIILADLTTDNAQLVHHCAVLTKFGENIIISDATIDWPTISSICVLTTPQNALERVISNTNVQTYQVKTAVSLCCSETFQTNDEFYAWI